MSDRKARQARKANRSLYVIGTTHGPVFLNKEQPELCEVLDTIRRGEIKVLGVYSRAVLHDDPEVQSAIIQMVHGWGGQVLASDAGDFLQP